MNVIAGYPYPATAVRGLRQEFKNNPVGVKEMIWKILAIILFIYSIVKVLLIIIR